MPKYGPRTITGKRFIQASGSALFATVDTNDESGTLTFRIGQPTTYERALGRFARLWEAGAVNHGRRDPRAIARVRYGRRWYNVRFMEVRAVDRHGRGLGRDDHHAAVPVPYRAVQRVK